MKREEKGEKNGWKKEFSFLPDHEYDVCTNDSWGTPIGFRTNYPLELKQRIVAAQVSYMMQIGMDYAKKRYLDDTIHPSAADFNWNTVDSIITRKLHSAVDDAINRIRASNQKLESPSPIGVVLADTATGRIAYSITVASRLANTGALFEYATIARMIIEQIAWTYVSFNLDDAEKIKKLKANSLISSLKEVYPGAGRLYGWLSEHSHWSYSQHWKAINTETNNVSAIHKSIYFKVVAIATQVVIIDILIRSNAALRPKIGLLDIDADAMMQMIIECESDREELARCAIDLLFLREIVSGETQR